MSARLVLAMMVTVFLGACEAGSPPPDTPDDEPDWVELSTGKSCAKAVVACGPGNCASRIDNQCKEPVTCDLEIECICRALTGEEGPAKATAGEMTILAGEQDGLLAKVICDSGDVLATIARTVHCY
ncbi:MAG: hypothetical protein KC731_09210 [Myxococcales bacterium]|nr:hypothetical protein [Myxococcales bacterium]